MAGPDDLPRRVELRAHTASLNALRETQIEQGRTLNEHSSILNEHSRLLSTVHAGVVHITDLLTRHSDD